MNISGIYKIESKIKPERIYIGSAINIKRRKREHLFGLRNNKHGNGRLQNHFNKYGESDLVFSTIVGCEKENLISYEQFYIDALNPYFNICKNARNCLGKKASEETRKKLSESHKGYVWSEESKLRLSQSIKGRKLSEYSKRNMKGKVFSDERKRRISESQKGRIQSEETKEKISQSKKGKSSWNKGIKTGVSWNKGKTGMYSEETIKKMSDAKKGVKRGSYKHVNLKELCPLQ